MMMVKADHPRRIDRVIDYFGELRDGMPVPRPAASVPVVVLPLVEARAV